LKLEVDNKILRTKRGYVLGMFNYGFSLISKVIFEINPEMDNY